MSGDDDGPPFVDGLLLGALVGAAIAGSALWNRWRGRATAPEQAEPEEPSEPRVSPSQDSTESA